MDWLENMPYIPPRLHSEFFDLLKRAESILEHKANIPVRTARMILNAAVTAYVSEARLPFYAYLLAELRKRRLFMSLSPAKP